MRKIMVLNPKGGCGKTTLATNLAAHYAAAGKAVSLVDLDVQKSAAEWWQARDAERPPIDLVEPDNGRVRIPPKSEVAVLDAPAAVHGKDLTAMVKRAETLLIPVLPSPVDIRAAAHFIEELLLVGRVSRRETRVAVVANRVREYTLAFRRLEAFLEHLAIPFVATLRDTQNYVRAAERGLGVCELPPHLAEQDVEQWQPLLRWLKGRGSRPAPKKKG